MADTGYPRSWKFRDTKGEKADGATLFARWTGDLEYADTKFGQKLVGQFTLSDADGKDTDELVSVWLFNTALESQFKKVRPEIGELIKIEYRGERDSKAGNTYQDFKIVSLDKPAEKLSWDVLGTPEIEEDDDF